MHQASLKAERSKLEFGLCCLHSAVTAGDIRKVDYDIQYFSLCLAIARIDKALSDSAAAAVQG